MYKVLQKVGPMVDARVRMMSIEDTDAGHGISLRLEPEAEDGLCEMLNEAYERGKEATEVDLGQTSAKPNMDDRSSMSPVYGWKSDGNVLYPGIAFVGPGVRTAIRSNRALDENCDMLCKALECAYLAGRDDAKREVKETQRVKVDIAINGIDGEKSALEFADAFRALVKKAIEQ